VSADFLETIGSTVLCGDGAMGTLLMERGVSSSRCFEELCVSEPSLISDIHAEYLAAGARVIETNSFGANAVRLERYGLAGRINEINWQAAQLAKQAAKGTGAFVAGSVGPLGISEEEARLRGIDRKAVFQEQIGALLDGGVNVVLFQTFSDVEELLLALYVKQSFHHCPAICLFACDASARLPGGLALGDAFLKLRAADADVVGINCVSGPQTALQLMRHAPANIPFAVYPNAGRPHYHEGRYVYDASPEYFGEAARKFAEHGASLIGGCCGTTPEHIRRIAEAVEDMRPVEAERPTITVQPAAAESCTSEPSLLDRFSSGRPVIITEFDPPKNLDLEKYLAGARALSEAGSDALTLADNSLAILRMSNLAAGILLREMGIQTILHLSCRDRNLLGLQSDLLGMAAHGLRHVLPLTGDPAKVGDHPGASSVYDVTSIELIRIISDMNKGFTQSGGALKKNPEFVIGCTFNPNARNLDAQISRLERKLEAGAHYVMTQPVFDTALACRTAEVLKRFSVPIFIGVWPLLSGRQARFLHHEVPGISIPDNVLSSMADLEGEAGVAEGLRIAEETSRAILDHFPGIYLITPFLRFDVTEKLVRAVRGRSAS